MFDKVFIANRGEIAVRVARACRLLGVESVAAFSDADADAVHVAAADGAARVGPAEALRSYLDVEAVVDAAVATGCDAVHPGYGFLAENAALAEACAAAGIVFIGPPVEALRLAGDKVAARTTMHAAGVPVVPGTFEASNDPAELKVAADDLGYPLLIKACGGGGGTGMRKVAAADAIEAALGEAAAEAGSAFGDASVYLEKLIAPVRHVEVQVLADTHGSVVAMGERECSIQRRHQKVIEESPSPAVSHDVRDALCKTACDAARAAGYVNAGTVEFLLKDDGTFYFLEMNARIQVEHPVTEMRFGADLVAWQLRVAVGEALPPDLGWLEPRGWAIEGRLYAEDPDLGLLPSAGRILHAQLPSGPGIRVDAGIASGSRVPLEYDPILAKIIAWGEDRETARRRLDRALAETVVLGVASNAAFLRRILAHPDFVEGRTHTALLEDEIMPILEGPTDDAREAALVVAALALDGALGATEVASGAKGGPAAVPGPWETLRGKRFPAGGKP
ncbi:MAG: biotin carboxylase N-terminal domain-containing protein [Myxococcota bacterium]|jgi:acetyl-CoA/propionyl-CoA carboxylase biotin carboxyl carrier protein|nr:biotin carboxylase N-terminal domain-containing protein [Myxococcota bacterium]